MEIVVDGWEKDIIYIIRKNVFWNIAIYAIGSNGIIQRLAQVVRQAVQVRTIIVVLQSSC